MDALYVKACFGSFALYGMQMLFVPGKMVTDHFDAPATPLLQFWIRGQAATLLSLCYAASLLPTADAVKIGAGLSLSIGILYPWNAKFGYLTPNLPVKYPMHYVPELLMLALSAAGAYLVLGN